MESFFDVKLSIVYFICDLEDDTKLLFKKHNFFNVKDLGLTKKNKILIPLNQNINTNKINPEIHETTHAFMDSIFDFENKRMLPLWFYEGVSQIFDAFFPIHKLQIHNPYRFRIVKDLYDDLINGINVKERLFFKIQNENYYDKYIQGDYNLLQGKLLLYHLFKLDSKFIKFKELILRLKITENYSQGTIFYLLSKIYGNEINRIIEFIFS